MVLGDADGISGCHSERSVFAKRQWERMLMANRATGKPSTERFEAIPVIIYPLELNAPVDKGDHVEKCPQDVVVPGQSDCVSGTEVATESS